MFICTYIMYTWAVGFHYPAGPAAVECRCRWKSVECVAFLSGMNRIQDILYFERYFCEQMIPKVSNISDVVFESISSWTDTNRLSYVFVPIIFHVCACSCLPGAFCICLKGQGRVSAPLQHFQWPFLIAPLSAVSDNWRKSFIPWLPCRNASLW